MLFRDRGALGLKGIEGIDSGAFELRQFVVGPLETNCYAIVSEDKALVIDPGFCGGQIAEGLAGIQVETIACTHGHFDHTSGVAALKGVTGAAFVISALDSEFAQHAGGRSVTGLYGEADAPAPDRTIAEGDTIGVGNVSFKVIETPGHTPGGLVFLGEGMAQGLAFVGDTLFAGSAGRTDLAGGNYAQLMASLKRLKEVIPPATYIFCGHGAHTTMQAELYTNPYLLG